MPEEVEIPANQKDLLVVAVAQGKSVASWARQNGVPTSTAYRWANDPDVRRRVNDWRRRFLDRSLGWMATHSRRAVKAIVQLGENAESETVRLSALRALLHDQIAVSRHADLEFRVSELEESPRARAKTANGRP
jgi:hypothetical protein